MKLFTDNIISRKDSKINNVYANMQTCKHFIFLQKDSWPSLEVWPPFGNRKKVKHTKTLFLHFCIFANLK